MRFPSHIRLSTGPRLIPCAPPPVRLTLTVGEVLDLALLIERRAAEADAEGVPDIAERLHWRAAALREAVRP